MSVQSPPGESGIHHGIEVGRLIITSFSEHLGSSFGVSLESKTDQSPVSQLEVNAIGQANVA